MPLPSKPSDPRNNRPVSAPPTQHFGTGLPVRPADAPVHLPQVEEEPVFGGFQSQEHAEVVPLEELPDHFEEDDENDYDEQPAGAYVDEEDEDYNDDDDELDEAEKTRVEILKSLSESAKNSARLLLQRISDDKSSEVLMNGPKNIMVKENGNRYIVNEIKFEDVEEYHAVINALILHDTDSPDRIGSANGKHLIEGQLELQDYDNPDAPPLFARVHVLTPPVVKAAKVTIAKKAKKSFRINDFVQKGTMNQQMGLFLQALARGKATIVLSGLSGAGKTTLMESLSYEFDENDRVVVVEDTAELRLPVYDVVPLLATSRKPGQDPTDIVTLEWLVAQANRMRPDRIIVGESRGGEFAEFLTAANSGADGSMTTIHASSTRQALDKMRSLAMKSATARTETSVTRDIASTVQIVVQMGLIDGRHVVQQIDEISNVTTNTGVIPLQPLFEYDRNLKRFIVKGRPSDNLTSFLSGRGVTMDRSWFDRS